jgi:hypothetical protein
LWRAISRRSFVITCSFHPDTPQIPPQFRAPAAGCHADDPGAVLDGGQCALPRTLSSARPAGRPSGIDAVGTRTDSLLRVNVPLESLAEGAQFDLLQDPCTAGHP